MPRQWKPFWNQSVNKTVAEDLQRIRSDGRPIGLVLDNARIHHAQAVKQKAIALDFTYFSCPLICLSSIPLNSSGRMVRKSSPKRLTLSRLKRMPSTSSFSLCDKEFHPMRGVGQANWLVRPCSFVKIVTKSTIVVFRPISTLRIHIKMTLFI